MGDYNFDNLAINIEEFDRVVCDKSFKEEGKSILKLSFKDAKEYILENHTKENILYVVTGSPLFYSAGILIAKRLPKNLVKIIDNTSSKSYLLQKLIISETEVESLSLHGRNRIDLNRFLVNRYTFILCDKFSIDRVKEAIKYLSPKDIEVIIGYKLGYSDEVIEQIDIFSFSYRDFDLDKPFVLLIKKLFQSKPLSRDIEFETQRGMITKEYKRNLSLQNLDLEPNQILWDIGAGSGSCAIEAFKRYRVKTILFEKQPLRCEFIKRNLSNHFVCDTLLIEAEAERVFVKLKQRPDRIFVGGGGERVIAKLPYLYNILKDDGVMLISAITLKNLSQMITILNKNEIEYRVISISLTTYKGKLDLIQPERQLFQIKIKR
jgi:precorrin-6Y C5,15-methyltransferase (decarboxylating)